MASLVANAAVIDNGRILLTKRDDFHVWCLPSGGIEDGESAAEAAIRETREETGIEVELVGLVGLYFRAGCLPDGHAAVFAARPVGGALRAQPGETLDVCYFTPEEFPEAMAVGHRQRALDALAGLRGMFRRQCMRSPFVAQLTPAELRTRRDESRVLPDVFYRQFFEGSDA